MSDEKRELYRRKLEKAKRKKDGKQKKTTNVNGKNTQVYSKSPNGVPLPIPNKQLKPTPKAVMPKKNDY